MTVITNRLKIEINRLESEVQRLDAKMENAVRVKHRRMYRNSKDLTIAQRHKLKAQLVANTLKKLH